MVRSKRRRVTRGRNHTSNTVCQVVSCGLSKRAKSIPTTLIGIKNKPATHRVVQFDRTELGFYTCDECADKFSYEAGFVAISLSPRKARRKK